MRVDRVAIWALSAALALLVIVTAGALAQDVPLPAWVRSGEVNDDGTVVYSAPDEHSARRGTVAIGTRLPVLSRAKGAGCGDFRFVQVGSEAFVCEAKLVWSKAEPFGVPQPLMAAGALLPREHLFVTADGTGGFARPSDVLTDEFAIVLGQNFGISVSAREVYEGQSFVRSAHGYYVSERALRARPVSAFAGITITDGKLEGFGWVVAERVLRRATPKAKTGTPLPRLSLVRIAEDDGSGFLRLSDGGYISARDLVRPQLTAAPVSLLPGERFIDVDTQHQTLVVYEGARPIFATLVSTGVPEADTPLGEFRIWAKLARSDMNDTEQLDLERNYSIEAVPWVLFFNESIALHAAFWHDRFGEKHSHGCVNLSPKDARTVFGLAQPALPDGYYAILPTPAAPSTRVRVR